MKRTITESQLKKMIAESIKSTLNEIGDTEAGQWMLGRLAGRKIANGEKESDVLSKYGYDGDRFNGDYKDGFDAFNYGYDLENGDALWKQQFNDDGTVNPSSENWYNRRDSEIKGYANAMKSMIRRNAMKGRNQAINEDEEFDEMQFEKEREILRKCCNQVARPIRTLMDNVNKLRPIYCKEDFDKIYDAAGIIASYADVDGLSAETDIRYKNNG